MVDDLVDNLEKKMWYKDREIMFKCFDKIHNVV